MEDDIIDIIVDSLLGVLPLIRKKLLRVDFSVINKDITLLHFIILQTLVEEGALPISAIARIMLVPRSQMTPWVDRLIELGLARRVPDKKDRRVINTIITENGAKVFEECRNVIRISVRKTLAQLSSRDLKKMAVALSTLRDIGIRIK